MAERELQLGGTSGAVSRTRLQIKEVMLNVVVV